MFMKNLRIALVLLLTVTTIKATNTEHTAVVNNINYNGKAYIFIEGGVEFSVFADGQFDFVYLPTYNNSTLSGTTPSVFASFNAGHNYEAYLQYDQYGAIIQIEDVPVFYDMYGRIIRAGDVEIRYINRRISRIGDLQIYYNRHGDYINCVGYINSHNRFYSYRPWHRHYVRPSYNNCIVWNFPYRRYYTPIRYSYYDHLRYYNNRTITTYTNGRREFISPGSRIHYRNGRTVINRTFRRGRKNTMVTSHGRTSGLAKVTKTKRIRTINHHRNSVNTPRKVTTSRNRIAARESNSRAVNNVSRSRTVYVVPKSRRTTNVSHTRKNTGATNTSRKTRVRSTSSKKRRL